MDSMYFSQILHDMHENVHGSYSKCYYIYDICIYGYLKNTDAYLIQNFHADNDKDVLG